MILWWLHTLPFYKLYLHYRSQPALLALVHCGIPIERCPLQFVQRYIQQSPLRSKVLPCDLNFYPASTVILPRSTPQCATNIVPRTVQHPTHRTPVKCRFFIQHSHTSPVQWHYIRLHTRITMVMVVFDTTSSATLPCSTPSVPSIMLQYVTPLSNTFLIIFSHRSPVCVGIR